MEKNDGGGRDLRVPNELAMLDRNMSSRIEESVKTQFPFSMHVTPAE